MSTWLPAALFALFAWWFSTGAILYVDRLPARTFRWSFLSATALLTVALHGLLRSASDTSAFGAYMAFTCALVVWGWHELTFLMGWVTGPRKTPCPPTARGWRRFWLATEVILHHELALAATVVLIAVLTWGQPNQVGTWTFGVLWVMRISAKLNIFLGVRNLTEEFIPAHLAYMTSYFKKASYNPLMPISLVGAAGTTYLLVQGGLADGSAAGTAGAVLVATLLGLAVLEHALLMLPIPDAVLWKWALRPTSGPE
jgi:putative photosynthetic complex assembly protein 2